MRLVADAAGCEVAEIAPRRRNGLLGLVVLIAVERGGLLPEEAADPCGLGSAAAVRMSMSRTRRRLQDDPVMRQLLATVAGEIAA